MVEVSYHPIGRESGPSLRVAMDCRSWLATEAAFTALGLKRKRDSDTNWGQTTTRNTTGIDSGFRFVNLLVGCDTE